MPSQGSIWVNPLSYNDPVNLGLDLDDELSYPFTAGMPLATYHAISSPYLSGGTQNINDLRLGCLAGPTTVGSPYLMHTFCDSFSKFFAKTYSLWKLNANGTSYTTSLNAEGAEQITDTASPIYDEYVQKPPMIAAVDFACGENSNDQTGCGVGNKNNFTVNRTYNDDVFIGSNGPVALGFFAWADAAQMPLRRIKIDFDNGSSPYVSESQEGMSNYKWNCTATEHCHDDQNIPCVNDSDCTKFTNATDHCDDNLPADANDLDNRNGFGSTELQGCAESYYKVYTNYTCDARVLFHQDVQRLIWDEATAGGAKYNPIGTGGGHLAVMRDNPDLAKPWELELTDTAKGKKLLDGSVVCAYRPKVQVLDNWGWCSGRCTHGIYTSNYVPTVNTFTTGCYNEMPVDISPPEIYNQCDGDLRLGEDKKIQNYIPFGGFGNEKNVIVIPSY